MANDVNMLKRKNEDDLNLLKEEASRKEQLVRSVQATDTEEGRQIKDEAIEQINATKAVKTSLKKTDTADAIERSELAREQGAPPSPKDGFMSTLALFIPTLIGGLAGAVTGGSEGLAAGLGGGLEGTKAGLDIIKQVEDIETTDIKQKALRDEALAPGKPASVKKDITPDFQLIATKEPVGTRETSEGFEFVTAGGDVVDPKEVESIKLDEQTVIE